MKPILFNTEMVKALLDGRKTVTRRVIKPQPELFGKALTYKGGIYAPKGLAREAPFKLGDVLWVRETWAKTSDMFGEVPRYLYRADFSEKQLNHENDGEYEIDSDFPDCIMWKPSIHMPKEAARIFLKVTNVKVERLQDMYVDDAIKEGAWGRGIPSVPFSLLWKEHPTASCIAIASFANLWDSTIKKQDLDTYGWDANPWVWVIEFERIEKE